MLPANIHDYRELVERFRWSIPEYYNIGRDVCDRWADADPDRVALLDVKRDGSASQYSFADIRTRSNRLCNHLRGEGLEAGDRIAILLPQSLETAVANISAFRLGAIAVPLFTLFGPDALEYRLGDSGARFLITDMAGAQKVEGFRDRLPALSQILTIDGAAPGAHDYHRAVEIQSAAFEPVQTRAEDAAIIIYTSGTTGQPKGALHAHRTLIGHLPGVEMSHDLFPKPGDRMWTPADWAWIGGLFDVFPRKRRDKRNAPSVRY